MAQIIRTLAALRAAVAPLRASGRRLALVPTMGALHDGHLTLVRAAKTHADAVAVSIFVNPTQFGPNEDLAAYPRKEADDIAMLTAEGVDIVWLPDVATMYPSGHDTTIAVGALAQRWDGAARPGHFDGVATVVAKLFNQVQPTHALFGEKDFQQLAVLRHVMRDLDSPVEIVGVPTARAADGLALSSRNVYLTPAERAAAPALYAALVAAAGRLRAGGAVEAVLADATAQLVTAGFATPDYLALVDAATLTPLDVYREPARLIAAARLGKARLIDNIATA